MTQEDKELLLKDLCARLPYDVKIHANDTNVDIEKVGVLSMVDNDAVIAFTCDDENTYNYVTIHEVQPYLFPLSSMTEEQERELIALTGYKSECEAYCGFDSMGYYIKAVGEFEYEEGEHSFMFYPDYVGIDWFNKNHFDYRGLIEKGLAIDATNLNIY